MEITSKVEETETVELRDYDIYFASGQPLTLTLEPDDTISLPDPLASGDIRIIYGNGGERGRVNGRAVAWMSERKRAVTRKKAKTTA